MALRASQINGCGVCTDMHTKDAALLVAVMNTVNRLNVIVQQPAGDYQPGQFGQHGSGGWTSCGATALEGDTGYRMTQIRDVVRNLSR